MAKIIINEELIKGTPKQIKIAIIKEIIYQLKDINEENYEDTCYNLQLFSNILEQVYENINEKELTFKYNSMGSFYKVEEGE